MSMQDRKATAGENQTFHDSIASLSQREGTGIMGKYVFNSKFAELY